VSGCDGVSPTVPLRDDLRHLSPYGAPQLDVAVRLNTNENPHPPPAELVEDVARAAREAAGGLNRYPDRDAVALRADLAAYLSGATGVALEPRQVWAANGSNEVLQQLLQAFGGPGRTAMGFEPSYSMHPLISLATVTRWVAGERERDFSLTPEGARDQVAREQPDVVFLTSPNSPTGSAVEPAVVEAVLEVAPGMVVVDEAYAEFSARPSALRLLDGHPRLVVVRTMSKAFALAGARVGYLAAAPEVVDSLMLVRLPYHLSALTQATARAALAHAPAVLATVEAVKDERDRTVVGLRALGLDVVDPDGNFVLFSTGGRDTRALWQALLDRGVLVRDVGLPGWLRVTAGLPDENDAFLTALTTGLTAVLRDGSGMRETA
jgi:histidinol-phosphate aminotransferase